MIRTSKLCEDTYNWVDWESSGRAIQGMRPAERVWVTKFASGFCGTASMMSRWKSGGWESDRCPLCGTSRETVDHLLWCSASSCKQRRHDATIDFVQWMRDNHTEASIQYCITQILQRGPSTTFQAHTNECINPLVRLAGLQQDDIGMMNFFRGRVSSTWMKIQDAHMLRRHVPTRRRGKSWMASFIQQIYRWCRCMWDHRNAGIHRREAAATEMVLLSDTDQKIIKEFTTGISGIRARDQWVISDTCVETILQKIFEDKLNWLRHVKAVRKRSEQMELSQMDRMRLFMEKWKSRRK